MPHVYVFAYGSNMLPARLTCAERAPSARWVGAATLRGHQLTFAKVGADGSGKCNIEPSERPEASVHGVVFRLDERDLPALDQAEGGYDRDWVDLRCQKAELSAFAYRARADRLDPERLAFDWYHALVLAGARHAKLPTSYVDWIAAQPTLPDPEPSRRARNLALLNQAVGPHGKPPNFREH